jgi:hypothetical protein
MTEYKSDLREIVMAIAPNARNLSNLLGCWLRERRDAWKGGMRIVDAGLNRQNARVWRIEGQPKDELERENFDLEAEKRGEIENGGV